VTSYSQRQPSCNGSGLPRADVAGLVPNLGGPIGSDTRVTSSCSLARHPTSKSTNGNNNGEVHRGISVDSTPTMNGFISSTASRHSSLSNTSGGNIYSTGVVQKVFRAEETQTSQSNPRRENVNVPEVKLQTRSMSVERHGDNRKRGDQHIGLPDNNEGHTGGRRHSVDDSRASMFGSSVSTSKSVGGSSGGSAGGRRHERLLNQQTSVSTACRAYSNLAVACSDDDGNVNGTGRDGGRQANGDQFDDEAAGGRRSVDCRYENRSTSSSMAEVDEERHRSLMKFSSLPNINQLKPGGPLRRLFEDYSPVDGHPRRRRQRRDNAERLNGAGRQERRSTLDGSDDGSDAIVGSDGLSPMSSVSLKSSATSSSRVATDVDVSTCSRRRDDSLMGDRSYALMAESMPCISSAFGAAGRGGRTPKRFLPSLSITEEVRRFVVMRLYTRQRSFLSE